MKLDPGRGGRDQREKKPDGNCIACHRDKRRNVPPKTRWKEEQKEKARNMGSTGKENLAAGAPEEARITVERFREKRRPDGRQRESKWKRQWCLNQEKPPWKESLKRAARSKHQEEPREVHGGQRERKPQHQ